MAAGACRPWTTRLRIAYTELVGWLHADYGLIRARRRINAFAGGEGPCHGDGGSELRVIASIEKKYLPAKK